MYEQIKAHVLINETKAKQMMMLSSRNPLLFYTSPGTSLIPIWTQLFSMWQTIVPKRSCQNPIVCLWITQPLHQCSYKLHYISNMLFYSIMNGIDYSHPIPQSDLISSQCDTCLTWYLHNVIPVWHIFTMWYLRPDIFTIWFLSGLITS